jgi:hypothetical protein
MCAEKRPATDEEIRARQERMRRRLEFLKASAARKVAKVERMRAEAGLPPELPRPRI